MWIVGGLGLLMVYLLIFVGGGVSASVLPVLLGFPALMIVGALLLLCGNPFSKPIEVVASPEGLKLSSGSTVNLVQAREIRSFKIQTHSFRMSTHTVTANLLDGKPLKLPTVCCSIDRLKPLERLAPIE